MAHVKVERVRAKVEPVRDPDTDQILGWVVACPDCYAYALTEERIEALNAARWHPCTWPPPPHRVTRTRWRDSGWL